jgi:hypothetical protein
MDSRGWAFPSIQSSPKSKARSCPLGFSRAELSPMVDAQLNVLHLFSFSWIIYRRGKFKERRHLFFFLSADLGVIRGGSTDLK